MSFPGLYLIWVTRIRIQIRIIETGGQSEVMRIRPDPDTHHCLGVVLSRLYLHSGHTYEYCESRIFPKETEYNLNNKIVQFSYVILKS